MIKNFKLQISKSSPNPRRHRRKLQQGTLQSYYSDKQTIIKASREKELIRSQEQGEENRRSLIGNNATEEMMEHAFKAER